jgi:uncharacterized membrane protein YeiB
MKRSTFNRHRLFSGFLFLVILFCAANYYLDLGFFGRGARLAVVLATAAIFVHGCFFSPTRQDMREYREASNETKD